MKKKTINIEPNNIIATKLNSSNKFTIQVEDYSKTININLEFWWVRYIAEELHKTITEAQERVNIVKRAMRGGA